MSNLAVGFTITQESGCGSLIFDDVTVYGAGGGSGELPSYGDIGKTTIEFDLSNGETVTLTNFVPTEADPTIQIFAGDLGYDDIIPDQICQIIYTIYDTGGNVIGTATTPTLFCCNFLACFYANAQSVVVNNCCDKSKLQALTDMWTRFLGIQASMGCNSCCSTGDIEQLSIDCSKFCLTGNCG